MSEHDQTSRRAVLAGIGMAGLSSGPLGLVKAGSISQKGWEHDVVDARFPTIKDNYAVAEYILENGESKEVEYTEKSDGEIVIETDKQKLSKQKSEIEKADLGIEDAKQGGGMGTDEISPAPGSPLVVIDLGDYETVADATHGRWAETVEPGGGTSVAEASYLRNGIQECQFGNDEYPIEDNSMSDGECCQYRKLNNGNYAFGTLTAYPGAANAFFQSAAEVEIYISNSSSSTPDRPEITFEGEYKLSIIALGLASASVNFKLYIKDSNRNEVGSKTILSKSGSGLEEWRNNEEFTNTVRLDNGEEFTPGETYYAGMEVKGTASGGTFDYGGVDARTDGSFSGFTKWDSVDIGWE
ncbi:hypothetical protein JT689_10825 [Halobacterium sp. GSL-19]|uniref:hypothetical protein n=1 Tax=Halobacterium sp. GSL-19 TaxID=2812551 RepID=UPI00196413E0|nr:hypothetical protein [Halobacterium sp. GSL-19]QRY22493.1 hypothetical protein JT689_10825 [Halobacterium sp. GSL-19]